MDNERTIGSLYARRRRLILGLKDFERRAEIYKTAIAEVEAALRILRPSVPLFIPRGSSQYFTSSELVRRYHDACREAEGKILTVDDVVIVLMQAKGLDIGDTLLRKTMKRRVVAMRRRMRQRSSPA